MLSLSTQSYNYTTLFHNEPSHFSLQDLRDDEVVQTSPLLSLDDTLFEKIVSLIPLKERLLNLRRVSKKFDETVKKSVKSVSFFGDQLDYCDDTKIMYFLSLYGPQIEYLNYDLFRTCTMKAYTQWSWRQSVIQTVLKCAQLRHLDILICSRHRIRDGDLNLIFKHCPNLESLKLDAQYIIGHCFARAPHTLRKVEMELCYRLSKTFFILMCQRLKELTILHVSQLNLLDDKMISKIVDMKKLEQLSIVADPDKNAYSCSITELRKLPKLKILCLEGINVITDRAIADFCDLTKSNVAKTLENVSFAYCRNIGSNGIQKLATLPKLRGVNLDGVSKRDISMGLEAISHAPNLQRLFLSDDTFVTPDSVINLVQNAKNLRLLDISGNRFLTETMFGKCLIESRISLPSAKKLIVLTDTDVTWMVGNHHDEMKIEIVSIHRAMLPPILPSHCAISQNTPSQLEFGYLCPQLRRGNRYKLIEKEMEVAGPAITVEDKENQKVTDAIDELSKRLDEQFSMAVASNFDPMVVQNSLMMDPMYLNTELVSLLNSYQEALMAPIPAPSPPTRDFNPFSSKDSFINLLTVGSGGAPCPPSEMAKKTPLSTAPPKYTRANRPQRKARKEHLARKMENGSKKVAVPKVPEPKFTEADFPPLG